MRNWFAPLFLTLDGRSMPSRAILDCRVVRFTPSRTAAPDGPPMNQLASSRAR